MQIQKSHSEIILHNNTPKFQRDLVVMIGRTGTCRVISNCTETRTVRVFGILPVDIEKSVKMMGGEVRYLSGN